MAYNPFCAKEEAENYDQYVCPDDHEKTGLYAVAFVNRGTAVDGADAEARATALLNLEKTCDAVIIRGIKGTYDGGSATYGSKVYANVPAPQTNSEHTLTFNDPKYAANVKFYNKFRDFVKGKDMYIIGNKYAWPVTSLLTGSAQGPIEEGYDETMDSVITVRWRDINNPEAVEIDRETLEELPTLTVEALTGAGTESVTDYTITDTTAGVIDVTFAVTGASTYELAAGSTLPDGLTFDTATRALTGTVAAPGTYRFTLAGRNNCGIAGAEQITLIIT